MKIEFRHADGRKNGWSLKDRLVAKLPDYAAAASRFAGLLNLRNRSGLLAALGERMLGFSAQRSLPGGKAAISSTAASPAPRASKCWRRPNPWCCSWTPSTASSNRPTRGRVRGAAGGGLHGAHRQQAEGRRQAPVLRPHLPVQRHGGRGRGQGHRAAGRAAPWPPGHRHRRPGAVLPAVHARRDDHHGLRRARAGAGQAVAAAGGVPGARRPPAGWRNWPGSALAKPVLVTATATRRPSARCRRCWTAGSRRAAAADRIQLLRHGRQLRLRGEAPCRVHANGRG